nr:CHAP domain-containing protein [Chloroflexaceae bacterium]
PVPAYSWRRTLCGFAGNRWQCWEQYVRDSVPGIDWATFRDDVLRYNPHLNADGRVFQASKCYMLPAPEPRPRARLVTQTDSEGRFAFALPLAGSGVELRVELDDFQPVLLPLVVNQDMVQPITLIPDQPNRSGTMRSDHPHYARLLPLHQRVIDAALFLLGDDRQTFDALPPDMQRMCFGARFLSDPNHRHFKDIVCADGVALALRAAGYPLWPGNTHRADYFHPARAGGRVEEINDPRAAQPGDVLVFGHGDRNGVAGHVALYVGPFSGTDRSGRSYNPAERADVVEASMVFAARNGGLAGTGVVGANLQQCLSQRRGYGWVRLVRLRT